MFEYLNKSLKAIKLEVPKINNSTKRFSVTSLGTFLTDDFDAIASDFEDYQTDNMVSAGVNMDSTSEFNDNTLDTLDDVETASVKILDAEDIKASKVEQNN